ncbi:MAG TPA: type III pantothenate kinase [candidate division Zixibacteria bacterium]|nr:type III pantothenate kinase [candidate division Zixibacteria bacterium]
MLIAIDVGNTSIDIGLFSEKTLKDHVKIASRRDMTSDEAGIFITAWLQRMNIENESIESVIISSVVPPLTHKFETTAKRYLGCMPVMVSHKIRLPITIDIDQPEQVGADRIANAVGGFTKFAGPVIVVDFGTATNFDIVNDKGVYIGGVLLPGPETSMRELAKRAARLFEVKIEPPKKVVGRSTAEALKSGFFYGTVGQVDYLIDKILEETGFTECRIVATGGLAAGIEKHSRHIGFVEPTLTLEGLRVISELN